MTAPISLLKFGLIDYRAAWEWQTRTAACVRQGGREALAVLEHPPVYTLGRRPRLDHLIIGPDEVNRRGADLIESDRGGDITFHGPGQLVGYAILDLRRRHLGPSQYVNALEETLISALANFGLASHRVSDRRGVWIDGAKVAAVGVRVQGGVTTHGFALNVSTDLVWFDAIVPCGISDAKVTSMEAILGCRPAMRAVKTAVIDAFAACFDVDFQDHDSVESELEKTIGR